MCNEKKINCFLKYKLIFLKIYIGTLKSFLYRYVTVDVRIWLDR